MPLTPSMIERMDGFDCRPPVVATTARIIVDGALDEMARVSGAAVADILTAMLADPAGNAARRFRAYVALGIKAADETGP